mgnify:CR=1 FL=1
MKDKQDLTTGSVPGRLAAFALPLLLANLLQSFYSIVDMLVVGISLAVAAVPEGLPAIVTVSLAMAVRRILRRKCYWLSSSKLPEMQSYLSF